MMVGENDKVIPKKRQQVSLGYPPEWRARYWDLVGEIDIQVENKLGIFKEFYVICSPDSFKYLRFREDDYIYLMDSKQREDVIVVGR